MTEIPSIAVETAEKEATVAKREGYTCWMIEKTGEYVPSSTTIPKLPPGKYKVRWSSMYGRNVFVRESINSDELLDLPNNAFREILSDINYFWKNKHLFSKYKFAHKRGILLWGNPGCGKSSITALLANQIINEGGVAFPIQTRDDMALYSSEVLSVFRSIEPNTPILALFEDLDSLVINNESETLLLNILDGINQSDNVVNIGCTNYPEKLEERILNRPSRFDRRYFLGLPDTAVRRFYLENKIRKEDIERMGGDKFIEKITVKTEGLTLAHLGEFIKSVFIFNNDVESTLQLLHGMKKIISSRDNDGNKNIGFSKEYANEKGM